MGWTRVTLAAIVVATALTFATPVAAQAVPEGPRVTVLADSERAQPETEIVVDEDSSATVRRIRRDLVLVAVALTAGVVVFVWHTNPARRMRVATSLAEHEPDEAGETRRTSETGEAGGTGETSGASEH